MKEDIIWHPATDNPPVAQVGMIQVSPLCLVRVQSKDGKHETFETNKYIHGIGWELSNSSGRFPDKFEVTHWAVINPPFN